MTTKLQIIGPYTPEHEGPFCTRDGRPVRILCRDMKNEYSIIAIVEDENGKETVSTYLKCGHLCKQDENNERDLMNAREVPVAREFWVYYDKAFSSKEEADYWASQKEHIVHVREVLPGDGE